MAPGTASGQVVRTLPRAPGFAHGSGTQRLYSFRDVVVLKIVKRFLDTGVSLQNIRTAVQHLRERGFRDLERMTLMSDGATDRKSVV